MKYLIYPTLGTVYWRENGEIMFTPLNSDGSFDTDNGGSVEVWDEVSQADRANIESLI